MSASHGEVSRRAVLQGIGGAGVVAALLTERGFKTLAQTEVAPTPQSAVLVREVTLGQRKYAVKEDLMSAEFAPVDGSDSDLTWEISFPDLLGLVPGGAGPVALFDVKRAGERVSQISMQWGPQQSSYRVVFSAKLDYLSLFYPNLFLSQAPVIMKTATETYSFSVDAANKTLSGDVPSELEKYKVVNDVLSTIASLREPLTALQNQPRVLMQSSSGGDKTRCDNDRKAGWVIAVGAAILGGLAVPTGGLSAVIGFAVAGSVGGAQAAKTENEYKECKEKKEEKGK